MDKHDIVYILKEDTPTDELRYSIRSVCENFPYNRIWFVGGKPNGITPDIYLHHVQKGDTPWQKSTSSIYRVCQDKRLTEDFWLFNDDFFVMHKIDTLEPIYNGTIYQRMKEVKERWGGDTLYSIEFGRVRELLIDEDCDTYNYAVHVPMLINKKKALDTYNRYPDVPSFRCLYGNLHSVGGVNRKDVKISDMNQEPPDTDFLSTTETSFKDGKVGEYIRNKFNTKSAYED